MLELILLVFTVLANLGLAVIVFAKNSQKNVNKYFAMFAISLVGLSITNYISIHPLLFDQLFWIRFDMLWAALVTTTLFLLINVFPTDMPYFQKLERPVWVACAAMGLSAMSPWLFTSVDYSEGQTQPIPGPLIVPFGLYVVSILVLAVYILIKKYLTLKDKARDYVRFAIFGILSTFGSLVFFNFVLVIAFQNTSFIVYMPLFILIFSISFVYGMVRHRFFDLKLIVVRFIAYLLLLSVVAGFYALATVFLSVAITGTQFTVTQIIFSAVIVGILILFVQPLRRLLDKITRALFYQEDYNTKDVLDSLASVLVRSIDTNSLAEDSLGVLQKALKSSYITLFLLDDAVKSGWRRITIGEQGPRYVNNVLEKAFQKMPDVATEDYFESDGELYKKVQDLNLSVVARLETHGGIVGYCMFGYKTSGSTYTSRDIDLIRIARDELAIAVQNALRFDQIQELNATLQQRIAEATKELRQSNRQLQKLDVAKDEFISMASHQLRTPLTSVKGYLSMVLEGDVGAITKAQHQLLAEAFSSSERMVHLIGDFLNVSRLQTGRFMLETRRVDLVKVVSQEVDSLRITAEAHNLKIHFRKPAYFPMLLLDEAKIRQVIMNYIDNAIYYSHEGTIIEVKLYIDAGEAVFEVKDTGIGVPKEEQASLFTKFFRATNARKQRPDGTGVGLFLTKKVIDAHSGRVTLDSSEGKGSTFGFRLPIKKLTADSAKELDQKPDNNDKH